MKSLKLKIRFPKKLTKGSIPYESTMFKIFSYSKNLRRNTRNFRSGFTLVELIVSMSLFIVVVFIVTSAFLTLTDLSKKASATRIAIDNITVATEDMVRKLRTGYYYRCGGLDAFSNLAQPPIPLDCSPSTSLIDNSSISFFWSETSALAAYSLLVDASGRGRIMFNNSDKGYSWTDFLTSPEVNITKLKFYVIGAEGSGPEQPRINIVLQGIAGTDPKTQSNFSIYTSVTQRSPK